MVSDDSTAFLEGLLGKTLHITISDGRLLTGTFKASDQEANIILSNTFEYRKPSPKEEARALQEAADAKPGATSAKANMACRYIGLITVGPDHFRKIELEEKTYPGQSIPVRPKT